MTLDLNTSEIKSNCELKPLRLNLEKQVFKLSNELHISIKIGLIRISQSKTNSGKIRNRTNV